VIDDIRLDAYAERCNQPQRGELLLLRLPAADG
jgi:hypothetical protein